MTAAGAQVHPSNLGQGLEETRNLGEAYALRPWLQPPDLMAQILATVACQFLQVAPISYGSVAVPHKLEDAATLVEVLKRGTLSNCRANRIATGRRRNQRSR